jgi:hypothetical protein
MRTSTLLAVGGSIIAAILVADCSQPESKNSNAKPKPSPAISQTASQPTPAATPFGSQTTAPPAISRSKPLPPTGGDKPTQAEFSGHAYSYKKDGKKTVAMFDPNPLSAGDDVVGVIGDVIERSFADKVTAAPRRVGSGAEQGIRVDGEKHKYIIVPIKDPTGEIHSLIITQVD